MSRTTLKYVVAALLFVDMSSVAILGMLMAFVIPSGNVAHEAKFFLGLHRHEWGDIHLALSIVLLGLIAWHVWLGWDWVTGLTKKLFGEQWQRALWILSGSWCGVIFLAWMFVKLR